MPTLADVYLHPVPIKNAVLFTNFFPTSFSILLVDYRWTFCNYSLNFIM